MSKVVVVGGGWAGCAAAVMAAKKGCEVTVLERTDMLLGTGLVGGIMRNNGRFTATEEAIVLGIGDLFQLIDATCRHTNIEFPGHKHASLYDVGLMEPEIKKALLKMGVKICLQERITELEMQNGRIMKVFGADKKTYPGDVFIDTTGTAGGIPNCTKHGNGCAMCILRCQSFGGRVSLTAKAGVEEIVGVRKDGSIGAMSGSCKLFKESLAPDVVRMLNDTGVVVIPVPKEQVNADKLSSKACQQYASQEYAENIILLDTGHAKLMSPFYPLELLRLIPGMEGARYEDPYSGGIGNSMRYFGMAPRDDALKVEGVENLFCAGEKAGLLVGHTEAIITGSLAGLNAARLAQDLDPVIFPETLALGNAVKFVREEMKTEEGKCMKYTFSGSVLYERMLELSLYTTDLEEIRSRVEKTGLKEVIAR
jgi:hypothetical protein